MPRRVRYTTPSPHPTIPSEFCIVVKSQHLAPNSMRNKIIASWDKTIYMSFLNYSGGHFGMTIQKFRVLTSRFLTSIVPWTKWYHSQRFLRGLRGDPFGLRTNIIKHPQKEQTASRVGSPFPKRWQRPRKQKSLLTCPLPPTCCRCRKNLPQLQPIFCKVKAYVKLGATYI